MAKVAPPHCVARASWFSYEIQCPNRPNWRARPASSHTFHERLSPALSVTYTTARPKFFALCVIFINPRHVLVPSPRQRACRDSLHLVRGSREIRPVVASIGEQLRRLSQPPLCDRQAHKAAILGRQRRRSVRVPPFPTLENQSYRWTTRCSQPMDNVTDLRLHRPVSGFGPTMGVFLTPVNQ